MACYTFGSPPISEQGLECNFTTPIYRVVNEGDIVPDSLDFKYDHIGSVYLLTSDNCIVRSPKCSMFKKVKIISGQIKNYITEKTKEIIKKEKSIKDTTNHQIKTYIKKLIQIEKTQKQKRIKY